jgi:hypothetical protein
MTRASYAVVLQMAEAVRPHARLSLFIPVVLHCKVLYCTVRELQTKTKEMENGGLLRTDWPGRVAQGYLCAYVVLVGAADALE